MQHCCGHVAGSKASLAVGCYPWCAILPQKAAASDDTTLPPPTIDDAIDSFYKCLLEGEDGAAPQGMSCSTQLQRRGASAGSRAAEAGSLRVITLASVLGTLLMVALLLHG